MTTIEITTEVRAPAARCFDLARDIDLHLKSLEGTGERAVSGKTSGLIGLGEEVTWQARHFGINQRFTSRITEFDPPRHFQDRMVRGAFRSFVHDHFFEDQASSTHIRDVVRFESPLGVAGRLVDRFILRRYLSRLLASRSLYLKAVAEGADGKAS